jgi:hypothetical protein
MRFTAVFLLIGLVMSLAACSSNQEAAHPALTALASVPVSTPALDLTATRTPKIRPGFESKEPPAGLIAFAAGGSIYTINADGSGLKQVVAGDRVGGGRLGLGTDDIEAASHSNWASAPVFSPDGSSIAFVKDYDVWLVDADGGNQRPLAEVAAWDNSCKVCASNGSMGATNLAWSPDGTRILYVLYRIGGSGASGAGVVDVATGAVTAFDHLQGGPNNPYNLGFLYGLWLSEPGSDDGMALLWDGAVVHPIDLTDGRPVPEQGKLMRAPGPGPISRLSADAFLTGPWANDGEIVVESDEMMTQAITFGISPELSPGGNWIAYFTGESLRLIRTNSRDDHELVDLTPLGGRDRISGSQPDCYPNNAPACSYRPPLISWTAVR